MITVTITQTTMEEYKEIVNFQIESNPTNVKKVKNEYGGATSEEVQFATKNEPREVTKTREKVVCLLKQELADDKFNLPSVVKAVNSL